MIKEIQEDEFAPFFELMAEVECGKHFDFNNRNHIKWLKKRISIHFFQGTKFFGYFTEDNSPMGFAALLIDEGPEGVSCFGQKCELLDIGVIPQHRGKGIGSELLKYVEEYAEKLGVYCMYMSTYARDYDVIAFYGKNGFVPVATLPDVHGPNDEGIVFMRKLFERLKEDALHGC